MKSFFSTFDSKSITVTLRARVWVEMILPDSRASVRIVTLRARVWVEIVSVPVGLRVVAVTLRARVWVEIRSAWPPASRRRRHPPCEGVG